MTNAILKQMRYLIFPRTLQAFFAEKLLNVNILIQLFDRVIHKHTYVHTVHS